MWRSMSRPIALLLSSSLASGAAAAANAPVGQAYSVAPARHVVEIVKVSGNGSLRFVINGHAFTAVSGACGGWTAGDRVGLTAGEWHGYCATAVLRNVTRRRSCEVLCSGW